VKGVGLLIAGFKAAQLVARVASIAKSSVGVYQDAQNGEGGKVAVGVIAIAATSFLAFSRVGSKPISVIRGKQWLDGATKATAQQLFRSHPIAFTTLAAEHSSRAQFGPKAAIDAMTFVGALAIENGAEHVKHSLSSPRRVEPCLTNWRTPAYRDGRRSTWAHPRSNNSLPRSPRWSATSRQRLAARSVGSSTQSWTNSS